MNSDPTTIEGGFSADPPELAQLVLGKVLDDAGIQKMNNTGSEKLPTRHKIPENAEIIDLDSISDDYSVDHPASYSPIKLEDQDTLVVAKQYQPTKSDHLEPFTGWVETPEIIEEEPEEEVVVPPPAQIPTFEEASPKANELSSETNSRLQKAYAQRPINKNIPEGKGEFSEDSINDDEEDENAWMRLDVDFDRDAAATFANLELDFKKRKRDGEVDWQDEIHFMKAKNAENARLKRLKRLKANDALCHDSKYPEDDQVSDDDLFISSGPKPSRNMTGNDENMEDLETFQESGDAKIDEEQSNEANICMLAGIEEYLARTAKREAKKMPKSKRKQGEGKIGNRKGKNKTSKAFFSKSKTSKSKTKPNQPELLKDLFKSNIYDDANANLDLPQLEVLPHRNKQKILTKLLANIPLEDQKHSRGHRANILRSIKTLGNVGADGHGKWKMKNMIFSLLNHQVQGSGFMVERENGSGEPRGGLLADEMGLGKTIMTIATMISNPPTRDDPRPTLIVCPAGIINQWRAELEIHVEKDVFNQIIIYRASSMKRIHGSGCESVLKNANVVLTSFQEVLKSYPQFKPPKELVLPADKKTWWEKTYEHDRGPLHRVFFYRIVLDEAQAIKNHMSATSIACRSILGRHRWCITGTPIMNSVIEFYPFFKFLRIRHTGTFDIFKKNFCEPDDEDDTARLHAILKQIMIRRNYKDRILGQPLFSMPAITQTTLEIEFNSVERIIYDTVRRRFIERINACSRAGNLNKSYNHVLLMLLRLRQLTAHPFMIQATIEELFKLEDIDKLWISTKDEVSPKKDSRDMLTMMRKIIAEKEKTSVSRSSDTCVQPPSSEMLKDNDQHEHQEPLVFKFRKFLRQLANSSSWEALRDRSTCHKCLDRPDDPWITDCYHIYCKECLNTMASKNGEEGANCQECGNAFSQSQPCDGLAELNQEETTQTTRKPAHDDMKWIEMDGTVLPSSKTTAVQAQIERWLEFEPEKKIIVFSQFHTLMKILEKNFQKKNWGYCTLHGKMSHEARDIAVARFRTQADVKIMIASLKCGGVGLNLTMASRVICVDLWWNSHVEKQAFARIFRIGQESETFITRLIVKNTVDEKLQKMQDDKSAVIGEAIDSPKILEKRSLPELMALFGRVSEDENRKPFIMPDDDGEYDSVIPQNLDDPSHNGLPFSRP